MDEVPASEPEPVEAALAPVVTEPAPDPEPEADITMEQVPVAPADVPTMPRRPAREQAPVREQAPARPSVYEPETSSPAYQTTQSGYKKRVRGANVPQTDVVAARSSQDPSPVMADTPTSVADEMRSMLSGLQTGTERALAEVRDTDPEATEDGR